MFENLFTHNLKPLDPLIEENFIMDIKNSRQSMWIAADGMPDGTIGFVRDKTNAGFVTAKLKRFPNIVEEVLQHFPNVNIDNSYVTQLKPRYVMKMHIDKNRDTAILVPLGENKGELKHSLFGFNVHTHVYTGPALARVDVPHSATNTSDEIRYALTLEVPGKFRENVNFYNSDSFSLQCA